MMDFSWTKEQLQYRSEILDFANSLPNDVIERDKACEFSYEAWQTCADFGIQGMAVPKQYGGCQRADILTGMMAMEALGIGCRDMGLLLALNAQMWTVQLPIQRFGTADQQARFLPGLCSGKVIGAHAVTEPKTGSDAFSLETNATKCDGGYRLNGTKRLVTLAPIANLALVYTTIDPKLGKWGTTVFIVETDSPGFTTSPNMEKMGMRTVPWGEIYLNDCFVPEANRLGKEGAGFAMSQNSLEFERCCVLASHVGAMEHQLEVAVKFAKQRQQFGQPIGNFQSVSNRIAEMKLRLETARLLLYKVAWLKQQDQPAMLEAAMLKLYLSECFMESSLDAIRVQGGRGYLTDEGVERDLRDAVGGVLYAGTSDIQRNIIAKLLGL